MKDKGSEQFVKETIAAGIFPIGCATLNVSGSGVRFNGSEACENWWQVGASGNGKGKMPMMD